MRSRARAGAGELIDRDAIWAAQLDALERVFAAGLSAERRAEFAAFQDREGEPLDRFATWCAVSRMHGNDWRTWPAELHDPGRRRHRRRLALAFFRWLQWVLAEQFAAAQRDARAAGMRLGIVHDLAVGVSPGGADAWAYQDVLAHRAHRRRAAGRLLAARPGLAAAALAAGPAGRARLRAAARSLPGHPAARRRAAHRPHHRVVPALVDPGRAAGHRRDVRALRPRGDHRHPRARGAARRRSDHRRGPWQRRAVGAQLPRRARHPRHVDPLVRIRRARRPAARRTVARATVSRQ